jgi:predicted hotdog family 3-hydroxylacyl-ACP dehydratase
MRIDIAELIPHQGAMCLLESIEDWGEKRIVCRARSHRNQDNPLRDGRGLPASAAIEYGGQAIAAHVALVRGSAGRQARAGFLVAVRDVAVSVARLDDLEDPLMIRAEAVLQHESGHIYEVTVTAGERIIQTGRLSIIVSQATDDPRRTCTMPEVSR